MSTITTSRPKLSAALDSISRGAPRYAINTHWHWDHTSGNEWVHQAGARKYTFDPSPSGALPTVIVNGERVLELGGESLLVKAYPPSHTDGDLYVYFTKADVLATGDTYWNGLYPFIDHGVGGGIDGMIEAANIDIARCTDKTIVVPGHGPVSNRAGLIEYRDMLVKVRDSIAALRKQGKSLDETVAAKPSAAFDVKWGAFVINPALFTHLVYNSL